MILKARYMNLDFEIEEVECHTEGKNFKHSRFDIKLDTGNQTLKWLARVNSLREAIEIIRHYGTDEVTLEILS